MDNKEKYLSIGEIAKLTGSTVKSLRYYEKIGILKPIFIKYNSRYRYYSMEQIKMISIIQLCVELDIPLTELSRFNNLNEPSDYVSFLSYGKERAQKKLTTIQKGLIFIDHLEHKLTS